MLCLNIDSDLVFIDYSASLPNLSPELGDNLRSLGISPDFGLSIISQTLDLNPNISSFILTCMLYLLEATLSSGYLPNLWYAFEILGHMIVGIRRSAQTEANVWTNPK